MIDCDPFPPRRYPVRTFPTRFLHPLIRKALGVVALGAAVLVAGCDTEVLARAELGDETLELVDARGTVSQDGTALQVKITGWKDPSCRAMDDEVSVSVTFRIPEPTAVPLDTPIDVASPTAPLSAVLSMGSMGGGCYDCGPPQYLVSGTVTFTDLTSSSAAGDLALTLEGDVPFSGQQDAVIYAEDTRLRLTWNGFEAPMSIEHCD